jgi:hypothetical protein
MQPKELFFVIPTYRLREVGDTVKAMTITSDTSRDEKKLAHGLDAAQNHSKSNYTRNLPAAQTT